MEYNIVEAIDQPWKFFEGGVGPYWGILNADSRAEIRLDRPGRQIEAYWKLARHRAVGRHPAVAADPAAGAADRRCRPCVLSVAANGVGAWVATVFAYWTGHYFVLGSAFALTLGSDPAGAADADRDGADRGNRRDRLRPARRGACITHRSACGVAPAAARPDDARYPKVSIHIPAYFEPPEMLKQTLDAVAALDYPNFECVVIINNTPDPAFWQPIQDHCRALGERFMFINAEKVEGFKAGALRIAMERTAVDAEIIGIIDADYVVRAGLAEGSGAGLRRSRASASCRRRRIIATATAR